MSDELQIRVALARAGFTLDVELALPAQGITALFGPSGSGKTTLLRCVAGLEPQARGLVRVAGVTWQDDAAGLRLPTWQRPLGYVFQEASLFEHLDVRGNLHYGLRRAGGAGAQQALAAAVDLLGIAHLLARPVATLSGGERQRVAIARALATQPRLLLLDEPMAALDAARRQEILPWLQRLRDEARVPMLYVTHSADEVARLADHLVLLEAGRVRAAGPVAQVLASSDTALAEGEDIGTLVAARIAERDAPWRLARAEFDGGSLWIADQDAPIGQAVRLRVLARDVSLQRTEPTDSSVQNHLQARIEAIGEARHPSQALVRLRCGQALLLARVTRRAIHTLGLTPGQSVWALVKAVAVIG